MRCGCAVQCRCSLRCAAFPTARWAPTAPGPRLLWSPGPIPSLPPPGLAPTPTPRVVSKASRTTAPSPTHPAAASARAAEHLALLLLTPPAPPPPPPRLMPPLAGPGMASRGGDPPARASR
ncbi:hypothetical protein PVAP13_6NG099803 [Panicum virgatum]|uniref:Uncharacterized protein n=1 Tax=Panicum virgatum TaxID=38727 RepID=A0A8T0QW96_PANVG|nr:hypothetical protein PVAP13_6NG099803 [Panicum virgatum]